MSPAELDALKSLDDRSFAFFNSEVSRREKSTGVAYVLWFFLGWCGVHKFYLGNGLGWAYLAAGVAPVVAAVKTISAAVAGEYATAWDGLFVVVAVVGMAFLVIALLVDLFTLPGQVRRANSDIRWGLIYSLRPPADEAADND